MRELPFSQEPLSSLEFLQLPWLVILFLELIFHQQKKASLPADAMLLGKISPSKLKQHFFALLSPFFHAIHKARHAQGQFTGIGPRIYFGFPLI